MYLLPLLILVPTIQGLTFLLTSAVPVCLEVEGGGWYHIEYVVSGANENLVNFTINHKQEPLVVVSEKAEYNSRHELPLGDVHLCFSTVDSYSKTISTYFAQQHDNQVATKKELTKSTLVKINKAVQQMKSVYRNQHYQIQRDNQHKAFLDETEIKVKWGGIVKIIVLVIAGFLQFWILRRYVEEPPKAYSMVRT